MPSPPEQVDAGSFYRIFNQTAAVPSIENVVSSLSHEDNRMNHSTAPTNTTSNTIIFSSMEKAIIVVAERVKRYPLAPALYKTAIAVAESAVTARGDVDMGCYQSIPLAVWLHDAQGPVPLIDCAVGHDIEAVKHFISIFDVDTDKMAGGIEVVEQATGQAAEQDNVLWNREQCEAETRYASGSAMK